MTREIRKGLEEPCRSELYPIGFICLYINLGHGIISPMQLPYAVIIFAASCTRQVKYTNSGTPFLYTGENGAIAESNVSLLDLSLPHL
jgi:hypothetical protein